MSFKMRFQKQTAHLHEADELIHSLTAMRAMIPCRDSLKQDPSVRSMLDMATLSTAVTRTITPIPVDKMVVRTLGARDACHEFVVEFSKKFHETFLEVEVSSLNNVYEALDFYVRKGEAASPTMFDIGSAKKNCIHIRPGRSKFGYGRYYIAVASNGQTTRYSITCRQLYFRPDLLTPHEKAARTMINAELKSRIHQAERRRAYSRNGYTEALDRRKYLQETFSGGKETPSMERYSKWMSDVWEPFTFQSRSVTVKDDMFNPIKLRQVLSEIHRCKTYKEGELEGVYEGSTPDEACKEYLQSYLSASIPGKRDVTMFYSESSQSKVRGRKSPVEKNRYELMPVDRRILRLLATGSLPSGPLYVLLADAVDFRTHSWEHKYLRVNQHGTVQVYDDKDDLNFRELFNLQEISSAEEIVLDEQPSNFLSCRVVTSKDTVMLAATKFEDFDKWVRAFRMFVKYESPRTSPTPISSPKEGSSPRLKASYRSQLLELERADRLDDKRRPLSAQSWGNSLRSFKSAQSSRRSLI
ncbi:hypothetical protein GUITHDRAFT_155541 [Guillardia theta CCMP2712]|uniref:PH domain-containing protein n=1 Tax=Guillardia theta (strain CCMP2712) TaxID=905079 RepID=L1IGX0_GUITC|nr:hypothetical protein GUITHDRAFT_155541 [Guillardia theta CCMP2712]EKX35307.1 hypothetical protein GUITHDRAFT_155541 [Guillardia theta CCMP2712]|eukprot:XP_005822287.1 hypothetical protein GUITHDRAFT_155541 [Guillardia theta CCMP2712]